MIMNRKIIFQLILDECYCFSIIILQQNVTISWHLSSNLFFCLFFDQARAATSSESVAEKSGTSLREPRVFHISAEDHSSNQKFFHQILIVPTRCVLSAFFRYFSSLARKACRILKKHLHELLAAFFLPMDGQWTFQLALFDLLRF